MTYYPPQYQEDAFHCPICNVYVNQIWGKGAWAPYQSYEKTDISVARCTHCNKLSYWINEGLLYPPTSTAELPSTDLPVNCLQDFNEARNIASASPRGAAALLRLCIQKLLVELGLPGKNINDDIASLVKDGLPPLVQQSLDICRVVGNNAVHPGETDLTDTPEIAHSLFKLINIITYDRITRPKEVKALYDSLPVGALQAIERRDGA